MGVIFVVNLNTNQALCYMYPYYIPPSLFKTTKHKVNRCSYI